MVWRDVGVMLILSLVFTDVLESTRLSPPGKPTLTGCRSPEKETFTCWWEPGPDGGLPTNYSLYYSKENSDVLECPDYHTAGKNSCFFNKNNTSLWVNYNITVVATNALGRNVSDPVDVDVVYIVQPHRPENVTVAVDAVDGDDPFLLVRWEPPRKADTRSGWITLVYELRVKLEKEETWEEHFAGQQKQFNIFSPHSGEVYMVQVRCKPDHGFWSEWSSTSYVEVPDYINRERSMWILIAVISAFVFLIIMWIANAKHSRVKHFLLPPVPGPKIKGFDKQLLKGWKSEEMLDRLVIQALPPASDYEDLLVEYLEVYDMQQELVLDGKDLQEGHLKSKSPSDSDSGRGSCDSHTLLMEKCGEPKVDQTTILKEKQSGRGPLVRSNSHGYYIYAAKSADETNQSWPTVFSSEQHIHKPSYHSIPELSMQSHTPVNHKGNLLDSTCLSKHPAGYRCMPTYSEHSIPNTGHKRETTFQPSKPTEYVEVQKVEQENMLILKPRAKEGKDIYHLGFTGQDYSKVDGVVNDNILLLQGQMAAKDQESENSLENCPQQQAGKPAIHTAVPLPHEGAHVALNGYVDTATMLPSVSLVTSQREAS